MCTYNRMATCKILALSALLITGLGIAAQEPSRASDDEARSEPDGVLTLGQAVALTLNRNPMLAVYGWDIRAAEARRLQAKLLPNPKLSFEIEEIRFNDGPNATTRTFASDGTPSPERDIESGADAGFGQAEYTIALSQLIELGGKRAKRVRLAERERDVASWDYEVARADTMANLAQTFVAVLAAQQRLRLAGETVALSEQVLITITARVEAGKTSPIDKTKAQVELSAAQIEKARTVRELEALRFSLAAFWASVTPTFTAAAGDLEKIQPIPNYRELQALIAGSPDVARWAAEIEQRDVAVTLERANRVPDLEAAFGFRTTGIEDVHSRSFGAGGSFLGSSRTTFDRDRDNSFILEFSMPLPLFNRNQGSVKEAEHLSSKARAHLRAVELGMQASLAKAHQELVATYDEIQSLQSNVLPGAESVFASVNEGYREGKFNYLEVLDAQRTLFEARAQHASALASYHAAVARVERLVGVSLESEGSQLQRPTQE